MHRFYKHIFHLSAFQSRRNDSVGNFERSNDKRRWIAECTWRATKIALPNEISGEEINILSYAAHHGWCPPRCRNSMKYCQWPDESRYSETFMHRVVCNMPFLQQKKSRAILQALSVSPFLFDKRSLLILMSTNLLTFSVATRDTAFNSIECLPHVNLT